MWKNFSVEMPLVSGVYLITTSDNEQVQMFFKKDSKLAHWYCLTEDGSEPKSGWLHDSTVVWWWDTEVVAKVVV